MSRARINKIEVQGFRAFGQKVQTLDLPSPIAAIWGPNSQGKTSLAEAFEFLLTGQIVRRELMASGQDEFANALRNAHLPADTEVFIQAEIMGRDGEPYTLKRTLKVDYGKKQDCQTTLEINGKTATETDIQALGIALLQPPLRAPVLAQHTLGYLFSARPQDRANYFKALLEVTDLDTFRNTVAALDADLKPSSDPLIIKLAVASAVPEATPHLNNLQAKAQTLEKINQAFAATVDALIKASGNAVPDSFPERIAKLEDILAEKRAKTFPLKAFNKKPWPPWVAPTIEQHGKVKTYLTERAKVNDKTRRLTNLYSEALALSPITEAKTAIDCPLCESEDSLTPTRIAFIRERVKDTENFRKAEKEGQDALSQMDTGLQMLEKMAREALPQFISTPSKFRRENGFRIARICTILGANSTEIIATWLATLRRLARARTKIVNATRMLRSEIQRHVSEPDTITDPEGLEDRYRAVLSAYNIFSADLIAYVPAEEAVSVSLKTVIDTASETTGWQELIDLTRNQENLWKALIDQTILVAMQGELAQTLKQIDKGIEAVLDEKFQELSDDVQMWWDLLRPEETSFFSGVKPRPGARRTIDFKAGLSVKADRSDPKLRDVIAVFSQSQLHCLGLALFIARASHEGSGFIVLDDPILSSDEDYRAHFNTGVLEKLIDLGVQVVILTQDQKTWKDLGDRYLHKKISLFQIILSEPADGSSVTNTADDLATMLTRVEILLRGGHPSARKQGGELLRDATERFCKEVIVKDRRSKGDKTAAIIDHDGQNLGHLMPKVEPLLTLDPSHQGKLRAIAKDLNPANHDDAIPNKGALNVALGDLRAFKKSYL